MLLRWLSKMVVTSQCVVANKAHNLRVVVQETGLNSGEVRLSETALANVGLNAGEDVIVAPEPDLPEAERAYCFLRGGPE